MEIPDWKVKSDKSNIREGTIELRKSVSENFHYDHFSALEKAQFQVSNGRNFWGWKCISKFEHLISKELSSKGLEIGAGLGWCSSFLSKKNRIEKIYFLDYKRYYVETLILNIAKNIEASIKRLKPVIGSYNSFYIEDDTFTSYLLEQPPTPNPLIHSLSNG